MIEERIPISRCKREFNQVMRNLMRGTPDVYIITRKGKPIACIIKHETYQDWLSMIDKVASYEPPSQSEK